MGTYYLKIADDPKVTLEKRLGDRLALSPDPEVVSIVSREFLTTLVDKLWEVRDDGTFIRVGAHYLPEAPHMKEAVQLYNQVIAAYGKLSVVRRSIDAGRYSFEREEASEGEQEALKYMDFLKGIMLLCRTEMSGQYSRYAFIGRHLSLEGRTLPRLS